MKIIDLTGQVFTRLTVIERGPSTKDKKSQWVCRCECGTVKIVSAANLKKKVVRRIKSCGCLAREQASQRLKTHGESSHGANSREYHSWNGLIQRCLNRKCIYYPRYGGRGITVCRRWQFSFEFFLEDMGRCPKGRSLDRINNNGPYSKENCRWATYKEQANNRRRPNLKRYHL